MAATLLKWGVVKQVYEQKSLQTVLGSTVILLGMMCCLSVVNKNCHKVGFFLQKVAFLV